MKLYLKYGVYAVAMLAAVSVAHAQSNERNEEKARPAEHAPARQEEHPGAARRSGQGAAKLPEQTTPQRSERATERPAPAGHAPATENRRSAKAAPAEDEARNKSEQQRNAQPNEHRTQGQENRQRQSNAAGAAHGGNAGVREQHGASHVNFHVSAPQRTELHNAVIHDSAIHVYHRGEVNFAANVGERLPDSIQFFPPPPIFVEVDPEFQGYMIVVLDDEILIVDPDTREIVDVLPA